MRIRPLCLLVSISLLPLTALAQSPSASEQDRLDRLERDMNVLQSHVYRSKPGKKAEAVDVSDEDAQGILQQQRQFQAGIEVRLNQLEENLRQINGKLEEMEFNHTKQAEELKKLSDDVNFRLQALEQGKGAPAKAEESKKGDGSKVLGKVVVDPVQEELVKEKAEAAKDKGEPQARYDEAFNLVRQSKYPQAEKAFNAFISDFPQDDRVSSAYYWLGETYFVRKDYEAAAVEFLKGYRKGPTGPKAPDNLLRLGTSLGAAKKTNEACTVFGKLAKEFPNAAAPVKRKAELERTKLKCSVR